MARFAAPVGIAITAVALAVLGSVFLAIRRNEQEWIEAAKRENGEESSGNSRRGPGNDSSGVSLDATQRVSTAAGWLGSAETEAPDMSAESLAAARAAFPVGMAVRFTVRGKHVRLHLTGVVSGHRDTARGPYVLVREERGRETSVRPADVSEFHAPAADPRRRRP